jgi:hypothetical protein
MSDTIGMMLVESVGVVLTIIGAYVSVKVGISSLTAEVHGLHAWVKDVAEGKTEHMGQIKARQEVNTDLIKDHEHRIKELEVHCAHTHGDPRVSS